MTIVVIFLLAAASCVAQPISADVMVAFAPGDGQNIGQGPVFFPRNVLDMPDTSARRDMASADPRRVCSIGLDGSITLGYRDHAVVDEPGIDLVVFENAFYYSTGRLFAEPGRVSVSRDGITWHTFSCDVRTLQGCAGVTPTDPALPNGGGDGFDLAEVGIDSVRYVRIDDLTRQVLEDPTNPYWDPSLSGFDLDAIVALHAVPIVDRPRLAFDPERERIDVRLPPEAYGTLSCHDVTGALLTSVEVAPGITTIDVRMIPPGLVMLVLVTPASVTTVKVLR